MAHLPTTWKERKDADRERKVDRVMSDRLFQWTRTKAMRRVLVVIAAVLCVGILPAFTLAGVVVGAIITVAAWSAWGLVRMSIRTVADLPDRFLDERQRALRNRCYVYAYLVLAWIVAAMVTIVPIVVTILTGAGATSVETTLTITFDQAIGLALSVTLLVSLLPSMVVAWLDSGEDDAIVEIP